MARIRNDLTSISIRLIEMWLCLHPDSNAAPESGIVGKAVHRLTKGFLSDSIEATMDGLSEIKV